MLQRMKRQTKKITVRIATDNSPNVKIYIFIDCINEDIIFSSSILIFMFCVASLNDEKSVEAEDNKKNERNRKGSPLSMHHIGIFGTLSKRLDCR